MLAGLPDTKVAAVGGSFCSGKRLDPAPTRSRATISSLMAFIKISRFQSASDTWRLMMSCRLAGILLIKTGHKRRPNVSESTPCDARLRTCLLMKLKSLHKPLVFCKDMTASTCRSESMCLLIISCLHPNLFCKVLTAL